MNILDFMKERGYSGPRKDPVYGTTGVVYWHKKVPDAGRHQFVVRAWNTPEIGLDSDLTSFEIEMAYETREKIWAQTKFYGLSLTQLKANLDRLESCLKQALLYMDANPFDNRF